MLVTSASVGKTKNSWKLKTDPTFCICCNILFASIQLLHHTEAETLWPFKLSQSNKGDGRIIELPPAATLASCLTMIQL